MAPWQHCAAHEGTTEEILQKLVVDLKIGEGTFLGDGPIRIARCVPEEAHSRFAEMDGCMGGLTREDGGGIAHAYGNSEATIQLGIYKSTCFEEDGPNSRCVADLRSLQRKARVPRCGSTRMWPSHEPTTTTSTSQSSKRNAAHCRQVHGPPAKPSRPRSRGPLPSRRR